jgi:hypothetical protein
MKFINYKKILILGFSITNYFEKEKKKLMKMKRLLKKLIITKNHRSSSLKEI